MVSINNNAGEFLYNIDWEEGIINISSKGKKYLIENPQVIFNNQPKNIPFGKELQEIINEDI